DPGHPGVRPFGHRAIAEADMSLPPRCGRGVLVAIGLVASLVSSRPPSLGAQTRGTVLGAVRDSVSGEAIPSANVSIAGTRLGAVTTNLGSYVIHGVPAGPQTIRVARIGYAPVSRSIVVGDADVTADFKIARTAVQLEEVVTTVTGAQRKAEIG